MKTHETANAINSKKPARGGARPKVADSAAGAGKGDRAALAESSRPVDEIDRLATMKTSELQALVAGLTGEKTRCPNRAWLIKKVVEAAASTTLVDAPPATTTPAAVAADKEALAEDTATEADPGLDGGPAIEEVASMPTVDPAATMGQPIADQADTSVATGTDTAGASSPALPKLSNLDVAALRSLYAEVVGRETQSTNAGYLRWKISQARRGAVPTGGPRRTARAEGTTFKVLPIRLESGLVDKLDEAWRRQGLASRMDLFRVALRTYLGSVRESEVAAMLEPR